MFGEAIGKVAKIGVVVALGVVAFDIYEQPGGFVGCIKDPSPKTCLGIDWHYHGPGSDVAAKNPDTPMFSNINGGIVDIKPISGQFPLFSRDIELEPLQVTQHGDVVYQENFVANVQTSLVDDPTKARLSVIEATDDNGVRQDYVVEIKTQGDNDPTNDVVTEINVNDFKMIPGFTNVNIVNVPADNPKAYDDCKAKLLGGDDKIGGCKIVGAGTNKHTTDPKYGIVGNLESVYFGDEDCTVKTLHVVSNVVLGGEKPNQGAWKDVHAETLTVSEIAAVSIHDNVFKLLSSSVLSENVHVVMAMDNATGKPVEYAPPDIIDVDRVAGMSEGHYAVPDVFTQNYCAAGGNTAWPIDQEHQKYIDSLSALVGPDLMDPAKLNAFKYTPVKGPAAVMHAKFNPDGSIVKEDVSSTTTG